jgi:hypothetical protein
MSSIRIQTPAVHRTTAALIETIRQALDGDGSFIEPGSVDSQGLTVIAGVHRVRIELSEPELADWLDHSPVDRAMTDDHPHDAYIGGHDFDDEGYEEPAF